jgi:uroporphyrinogen-III synthase
MMQQLQQQGVEILNFVLYRRQCPIQSVTLFPKILKNNAKSTCYGVD